MMSGKIGEIINSLELKGFTVDSKLSKMSKNSSYLCIVEITSNASDLPLKVLEMEKNLVAFPNEMK